MHTIKASKILFRHLPWLIALFQAWLVFCSLLVAWLLRFDFSLPDRLLLFSAAPILIVIRLTAIAQFGLLHGWWRYSGVSDALDILKAITLGSAVFLVFMQFVLGVTAFPNSVYVLEAVLSTALLVGDQIIFRSREITAVSEIRCSQALACGK